MQSSNSGSGSLRLSLKSRREGNVQLTDRSVRRAWLVWLQLSFCEKRGVP